MPTCGTGAFSLSPLEHISIFLLSFLKIELGSLHQKAPCSTRFHSRGYWSYAESDGRNGIYARFRSSKVIERGHRVQNYFAGGPIDKSVGTWALRGPRPKIIHVCFASPYHAPATHNKYHPLEDPHDTPWIVRTRLKSQCDSTAVYSPSVP